MQRFFSCPFRRDFSRFIVFAWMFFTFDIATALQNNVVKAAMDAKFADAILFAKYPFLFSPPSFALAAEGKTKFVLANKQLKFASVYSYKKHSFAAEYNYEGWHIFNTQSAAVIYAHRFSRFFTVSLKTTYQWQNNIESRLGDALLNLTMGISYTISPKFQMYSQFANPIHLKQYEKRKRNKEFSIEVGILYTISQSVGLSLAFLKDPMYPLHIECGLAYQVGKRILISGSTSLYPFQNRIGFTYCFSAFSLGFDFSYQMSLGYASSFVLSWGLNSKKGVRNAL